MTDLELECRAKLCRNVVEVQRLRKLASAAPPDQKYEINRVLHVYRMEAVELFVELKELEKAQTILNSLPPELKNHPDALLVQWEIYARSGQWEQALLCARDLVRSEKPSYPLVDLGSLWIRLAIAETNLGRRLEARKSLEQAFELCPGLRDDTLKNELLKNVWTAGDQK